MSLVWVFSMYMVRYKNLLRDQWKFQVDSSDSESFPCTPLTPAELELYWSDIMAKKGKKSLTQLSEAVTLVLPFEETLTTPTSGWRLGKLLPPIKPRPQQNNSYIWFVDKLQKS